MSELVVTPYEFVDAGGSVRYLRQTVGRGDKTLYFFTKDPLSQKGQPAELPAGYVAMQNKHLVYLARATA